MEDLLILAIKIAAASVIVSFCCVGIDGCYRAIKEILRKFCVGIVRCYRAIKERLKNFKERLKKFKA